MRFNPEGDHRTRVAARMSYNLVAGELGRAAPGIARQRSQARMDQDLAQMKQ
jgi:uncharacterized membrane protein